jgi:MFS family permease
LAGTLLAIVALGWLHGSVSEVIFWSAVPGVLVMLLLIFTVREPAQLVTTPQKIRAPLAWSVLSPNMRRYLLILVLFTFARVSESFIVLRGNELGMSLVQLLLLWAALNVMKSAAALLGGRLADAFGLRYITRLSWIGYAIGFFLLGWADHVLALWLSTLLYGVMAGLGEGSERALISVYATNERERGTAFGWYYLAAGLSAIPAGVLFGTIWHYWNAGAAFLFAAGMALLCVLLLRFWHIREPV